MRRLLCLLAAAPMLIVAGCSSDDPSQTSGTGATWVLPSGSAAEPTIGSNRTSVPSGSPAAAPSGVPRCHTKDLKAATGAAEGAAGTLYLSLVFTNVSKGKCTLRGYPIVAWVDAETGKTINKPFTAETGEQQATVTLAPGGTAHATLAFHLPGEVDPAKCESVNVSGYRVLPPQETTPMLVASPTVACSAKGVNTGKVLAIAEGAK
jgi:hypothetical protein